MKNVNTKNVKNTIKILLLAVLVALTAGCMSSNTAVNSDPRSQQEVEKQCKETYNDHWINEDSK